MGIGEYVSVSSQRDAELALIEAERADLEAMPEEELDHLTAILQTKGMSPEVAREAAVELSKDDVLKVHAELEFGIDIDNVTSPWAAAGASMLSFFVGAVLPVLTILLPSPARFIVTGVVVAVALAITGFTSAKLGKARPKRAVARNVVGGIVTMAITLGIGALIGTAI
jgi:VIT1/CCC1 family predicted Fe2+/Mn2+ transporter